MTSHSEAVAAVDGAVWAVTAWCDQVRQAAEQRMGLPAGAESAIGDPWYQEALEIRADLTALRGRLTDPRNGFS
ncbi:hypothetical protein ACQP2H_31795 (plasmid) [Micromonospora sp. CA-248260]|uniref:hypothetical protein n=1 Tax=unclassified Micromonospora TaxID=2617518 RepID=UPI003B94DD9C